jgi:hypothetical protein
MSAPLSSYLTQNLFSVKDKVRATLPSSPLDPSLTSFEPFSCHLCRLFLSLVLARVSANTLPKAVSVAHRFSYVILVESC